MTKTTVSGEVNNETNAHVKPHPKVLIVGQPFNSETGGGITLSNLFEGWDKNSLAVVCSAYLINQNTDTDACSNYYQMGHKEIKWIFPFNLFKRKHYSGPIQVQKDEKKPTLRQPAPNWRKRLIENYFYPALEYLGIYNFATSTDLSPQLRNWIDEYQPDIIYAQVFSRKSIKLCTLIHQHTNKPLAIHIMDDWPSLMKEHGLLGRYWYDKVNRELIKLFGRADLLLSISDQMALEYKKRYGHDFVTFHNPININFWKQHRRHNFELSKSPTVLYAGRVGTGIDSSLKTIAEAITETNASLGSSLSFVLQTAEKPSWADKYDCVKHKNFVAYEELPKAFASADFLILPYDFSEKSIKFIGHSMPTKAPEYMASGSPIIVFAPEVTALVQYAKKYDCAKVITENKVEVLTEAIKSLMLDQNLRARLSKHAVETVDKNHNAVEVRNRFQSLICSLQSI